MHNTLLDPGHTRNIPQWFYHLYVYMYGGLYKCIMYYVNGHMEPSESSLTFWMS